LLMADIEALCNNCEPQPTPGICPIHNTTHGTQSQSQPQYGDNYGEDGYGGENHDHHHSTNTQSASQSQTPAFGGRKRDGENLPEKDAQKVVFPGLGAPVEAGAPSATSPAQAEEWRPWTTFVAIGGGALVFVGILVMLIYYMRQARSHGGQSKSIIISQSDGGAILMHQDTNGRIVQSKVLPDGTLKHNAHNSDWAPSGSEGEEEDGDNDTGMEDVQLSAVLRKTSGHVDPDVEKIAT
jgi:hypothetical protein